jgi:type IV secretory pathway VirJ component
MKNAVLALFACLFSAHTASAAIADSISYGPFGKIMLYHPAKAPTSVALFVSGDGGWGMGIVKMAKNIADQGALVLGIDANSYKKSFARQASGCLYPASDFENLSLMIQKKYKFPVYLKPVLVGYSYGATLIYGILAQAPANTFKGAIALGFCPDIQIVKPLCKGTALTWHTLKGKQNYYLEKTTRLTAPFIVLNGFKDLDCVYAATSEFLKDMPMAELVTLPQVGHGFAVSARWAPQLNAAYKKIADAPSFTQMKADQNALLKSQKLVPMPGNLPLTLIPSAQKNELPMVFFISGDGGWTSFDQTLSETMASRGMPVVGMDAQKYFWKEKTPEQSAADINKAIAHYMKQWDKKSFILMGFSFGASVVPFVANRLSPDIQNNIGAVIALSPDEKADFEIHITDMLNFGSNQGDYSVLSELLKIKQMRPVCVFGKDEDNDVRDKLTREGIKTITLAGGHHYNNNYVGLTAILLESISQNTQNRPGK